MSFTVYGISNCDTMRKARAWLVGQGITHAFHDYRKDGVDKVKLERWIEQFGWDKLLNRAGTTFRKLPDEARLGLDASKAKALMVEHPAAIRRPIVEYPGGLLLGFDLDAWSHAVGSSGAGGRT